MALFSVHADECLQLRVLLVALGLALLLPAALLAQEPCAEELAKAEEKYFDGEYDAAIAALHDCLSRTNIPQSSFKNAYKWMALIYIAKADE